MESLDWNRVLENLEKFATSESTRVAIRETTPLDSAVDAKNSMSEIIQALQILKLGQRPFMESLDLFPIWFQRLSRKATLKGLELKDVRHFCIEALALKQVLSQHRMDWPQEISERIMNAEEPLSAIDQVITNVGDVRPDASEELYRLTEEKKKLTKSVQLILDRIVKDHKMESVLQDNYVTTREGRWVLPVKSGMQHDFEGIIHSASQTKQTVFMEPQATVQINNSLREIETSIETEIDRLLQELSTYLLSHAREIEITRTALSDSDLRFAQAQLATQLQGSVPEFTNEELDLVDVRHPILVLRAEKVVANTLELNSTRRVLLLSGPNAGGKTVLLKSIGLAAQMARCGLPICAKAGSRMPFFNNIVVAVGDSQSVDKHLSTFAAHLKVLDEAAQIKGPQSLILIDEICGSTDPEEGTALARSFIETYATNEVFSVVTSHLGQLKKNWEQNTGVVNGSLEFDTEKGPTYKFLMGVPGQSLALITAERVGVTPGIVERALALMSPEQRKLQKNLKEIERLKEEVEILQKSLEQEQQSLQDEKSRYQKLVEKFDNEREDLLKEAVRHAEAQLSELVNKAKAENVFRKHSEVEKLKMSLPKVVKLSDTESTSNIATAEEFAKHYPPGSRVFATSIGKDAVVQGHPNAKGEVPILSSSMRLVVPWEGLKPAKESSNPTTEILRKTPQYKVQSADSDRVVDLRGYKVEEAISQLEQQLDTAALAKEDRVKIVHGHGTEALKRSIRSYLSRSVYVKKWSAGTPESGGDGVTWIELND